MQANRLSLKHHLVDGVAPASLRVRISKESINSVQFEVWAARFLKIDVLNSLFDLFQSVFVLKYSSESDRLLP